MPDGREATPGGARGRAEPDGLPARPVSRGAFRAMAAIGLAFVVLAAAVAMALPEHIGKQAAQAAVTAAALTSAICCLVTARRVPRHERRWRRFEAAAITSSFVAGVAVSMVASGETVPDLAATGAAPLLGYALGLAGLLTFPTERARAIPISTNKRGGMAWYLEAVLDGLLVVGSLLLLVYAILVVPLVRSTQINQASLAFGVAGGAGKLILLSAVIFILIFRRPTGSGSLSLLSASLLLFAVTDGAALNAYAKATDGPDAVVLVGFAGGSVLTALAAAASHDGMIIRTRRSPRGVWARVAVPYLPLGCVGALLAAQIITHADIPVAQIIGMLALMLLALARQLVTTIDNTLLLARYEDSRARLHHQAFHDPLTGLANRTLFFRRLRAAIDRHERTGHPVALLFCDLDDFKVVNDNLGHAAGDRVLRTAAHRLAQAAGPTDTVARLGGDEFAVLFDTGAADRAGGRTEELRTAGDRIRAALRIAVAIEDRRHLVRASLGLVIVGTEAGPVCPDEVLQHADHAMYAAKRLGKGNLVVYSPEIDDSRQAGMAG
ncbi:diguanylate cyclase [Parafrankia sp. EAN1pec]|uniref:GGDEF domain-containing protein n=1 Tax=Parafrankia sp. (strain EAN1pec) TaxID=298653 RepID=UPI00005438E1|nr:diguanylate cyclase [Frankia sp. EAN1pec]